MFVRDRGLGFRVEGLGLRVERLGFRGEGLGLRVARVGVWSPLDALHPPQPRCRLNHPTPRLPQACL